MVHFSPFIFLFQSTLPRREWRFLPCNRFNSINFNPHSHEGSDFPFLRIIKNHQLFQSTLPRREWRINMSIKNILIFISIHTPTKGVTIGFASSFFNIFISIHTPTKGVTDMLRSRCTSSWISIHTPTKGVTFVYNTSIKWSTISIHTPTKGVTFLFRIWQSNKSYFNPHSHEGSDSNIAQYFFNMMHNIDIFIKSEHKNLYSSINLCITNHFIISFWVRITQ